ncbi:MAG: DUF6544 family protein [bacterium]|jgi:hypothetical protein
MLHHHIVLNRISKVLFLIDKHDDQTGVFEKMWIKIPLTILALAAILIFAIVALNVLRFERESSDLVEELLSESQQPSPEVFSYDDLNSLPEPVQRYLKKVIPKGQPYGKTVYLRQRGEFRLGDETARWKSFKATQYITIDPPGFIWDGSIEMFPFIPVKVVDMYKAGEGALT